MLLSILILGGVFAIGLAISTLLLSEIRISRQSLDSVKAIYAAESGLECELFKYFKDQNYSCVLPNVILLNNTTFTSETMGGTATSASSIGISRNVRRGLKILIPI